MGKVYMMCAIAGSGKSTYIKKNFPNIPVVSRDILRSQLGFTKSAEDKAMLGRKEEELVSKVQDKMINNLCQQDKDFVLDNMNNRERFRRETESIIRRYPNMQIVFVKFNTPLDVCIKRREGQIPADVMKKIYKTFDSPKEDEYDELIDVPYEEQIVDECIKEEISKWKKI